MLVHSSSLLVSEFPFINFDVALLRIQLFLSLGNNSTHWYSDYVHSVLFLVTASFTAIVVSTVFFSLMLTI